MLKDTDVMTKLHDHYLVAFGLELREGLPSSAVCITFACL